jgi:hypothetical protein
MKINGHEIQFTSEHPQKAGTYLWKRSMAVETIHVVHYHAKKEFGTDWPAYYGMPDMGGRNIKHLSGEFCEIELDENDFS